MIGADQVDGDRPQLVEPGLMAVEGVASTTSVAAPASSGTVRQTPTATTSDVCATVSRNDSTGVLAPRSMTLPAASSPTGGAMVKGADEAPPASEGAGREGLHAACAATSSSSEGRRALIGRRAGRAPPRAPTAPTQTESW